MQIPTVSPQFAQRRKHRADNPHQKIWDILDNVFDPELPGVTIWDLGILQNVLPIGEGWQVDITPTYSGCPAVDTIAEDIVTEMASAGYQNVEVKVVLSPAWSSDMISPTGKQCLSDINIAPPTDNDLPACPVCNSTQTTIISQFGSTACKSLYRCQSCSEPFDYFKRI